MEIFMNNVSYSTTRFELIRKIAEILHGPDYARYSRLPLNFHINLHTDRRGRGRHHKGTGILTLPTEELGRRFLRDYGETDVSVSTDHIPNGLNIILNSQRHSRRGIPARSLLIGGRRLKFTKGRGSPHPAIVEEIRRLPYVDPQALEERDRREAILESASISLQTLQFGWECRDNVFSSEWEYPAAQLSFHEDRREIRIRRSDSTAVVIRYAQIQWFSAHMSVSNLPVIFFSLHPPPAFERESSFEVQNLQSFFSVILPGAKRQRVPALDPSHARVAPYVSVAIRLVCTDETGVETFRRLSHVAQIHNRSEADCPVEKRGLFSPSVLTDLENWVSTLDWEVAFQVEAMVRGLIVDPREMLSLRSWIENIIDAEGTKHAASLLRHFANRVEEWFYDESGQGHQDIFECFARSQEEHKSIARSLSQSKSSDRVFDCFHVVVTPTRILCQGPYPERSNRVIRSYPGHHDCFLRVSFADEDLLQLRFDREIDGPAFTKLRVGSTLLKELRVAGRPFKFLAYSQSALKEHAVWFVREFCDSQTGRIVNASTIIGELGNFANLAFDSDLIYCPARFGARVSQAFTSTDASTTVETNELMILRDIKNEKWPFTDGVGTISRDMARDIWKELQATRRKTARKKEYPRAFQVRFQGSKGVLSVDYTLCDRVVCLRDSMIKFDAPESRVIEIAQAFDYPLKYYLNRPLIMILEHLGVPYKTFKDLQDTAVAEAYESTSSTGRSARFLEAHGLGNSFRVTSVLLSLDKLAVSSLDDDFYQQMMEFAVHHVLRELKQRARIPVPGAYTLVGIADVHKYLNPGEIFVCVKQRDSAAVYLKGLVLISRSPTIHPGDVQVARAIGRPPVGSCFAREPLQNTVVFSVKGDRPLPSCLGGGDLDGDLYNLIPLDDLPDFNPEKTYPPGEYTPAQKKLLDRPCTMEDVAEFFVEYINSDVLGIIGKNWLVIADQSTAGVNDPDCMTLARLHSDAVDYPKSGRPVALSAIPTLKFRVKPDWDAPETVNIDSARYYESQRAIGLLSRAIDLPALQVVRRTERRQRHQLEQDSDRTIEDLLAGLQLRDDDDDTVGSAIETRVAEFISLDFTFTMVEEASNLFDRYVSELQSICRAHTISHGRSAMLTEEEVVVGTIVAKTSQPRKRRETMAKMREVTEQLVLRVREDLIGGEESSPDSSLERGWVAWRLSAKNKYFGSKSFGWIALGVIFEAIKDIEAAER